MMKMMMKRLSSAGLRAFAARFKRQEEWSVAPVISIIDAIQPLVCVVLQGAAVRRNL
jgi:hypothetical protein